MLEAVTRTSFHHQPEAQHPKSLAIHKNAGRLPHLLADAVEKGKNELIEIFLCVPVETGIS